MKGLRAPVLAEESIGGLSPLKAGRPGAEAGVPTAGRSAIERCILGWIGTGFECGRLSSSQSCRARLSSADS
eukprot:3577849-Heterocapsa_arctica.AAC.1